MKRIQCIHGHFVLGVDAVLLDVQLTQAAELRVRERHPTVEIDLAAYARTTIGHNQLVHCVHRIRLSFMAFCVPGEAHRIRTGLASHNRFDRRVAEASLGPAAREEAALLRLPRDDAEPRPRLGKDRRGSQGGQESRKDPDAVAGRQDRVQKRAGPERVREVPDVVVADVQALEELAAPDARW